MVSHAGSSRSTKPALVAPVTGTMAGDSFNLTSSCTASGVSSGSVNSNRYLSPFAISFPLTLSRLAIAAVSRCISA
jgi:hypothetical protein